MKQELSKTVLVLLAALSVALVAGCQTLQPTGIEMEPLSNYGGGGGGDN